MMENESLFQNKILGTVGIRRQKSDAMLESPSNSANLNMWYLITHLMNEYDRQKCLFIEFLLSCIS